jgi:hypothetical protein
VSGDLLPRFWDYESAVAATLNSSKFIPKPMHPFLTILAVVGVAALAFWAVLALVDRLQKGKKKNFPALHSGEEGRNLDGPAD